MGLIIEDANKEPLMPKAKVIRINGFEDGKAEPKIYGGDRLTWYACIPLNTVGIAVALVQGHAPSVRGAIADGIISARRFLASYTKELARLEDEIGSRGMTEEQLRRDVLD